MQKFFNTYDEANSFRTSSGMNNISKPFQRLTWYNGTQVPVWAVSIPDSAMQPIKLGNALKQHSQNNSCFA